MLFKELRINEPILKALEIQGYTKPTPIQEKAIPVLLEGKDLLGTAQTGTGKTAAFAIPIIQHIMNKTQHGRHIQALVLAPTRELAVQIDESFRDYGKYARIRHTVIFGGVKQKAQTDSLKNGVDVLIATPGRLLDLMSQGFVDLTRIEILVLDEADRMLDMGFIHDIKKVIAKLPLKRQTIFFSATMPSEVQSLVASILKSPVKIEVSPEVTTADTVKQVIYFAEKKEKKGLLQHVIKEHRMENVLVFTRTKHGANKVTQDLNKAGIKAEAIHGNKSQSARQNALNNFKDKYTRVLVATDIAARGIDVDDLAYVINFELPNIPETYVHRIGRTGRAGAKGLAISFCDHEERAYLKDIQKMIKKDIEIIEDHPFLTTDTLTSKIQANQTGQSVNKHGSRPKPNHSGNNNPNKKRRFWRGKN
jgi:ATP-dependent RNA helicase RhlE